MSAFLTLDTVSARTPEGQLLFSGLSLSVGAERIGIVGRNGSGKSTLMRIIAGSVEPASGSVLRSGAIGCLAQEWVAEFTLAHALGVADSLAVLQRVLSGEAGAADFDAADWSLESRIDAALAEVGVSGMTLDRRMGTLSGGERTRVGIARLMIEAPDLLLLDEPTNNLDAACRAAVHPLIRNWRGGVLVVSHDRALLQMMDRIVELTPIGVRIVGGGWSAFERMRDAERVKGASELERSEAEVRGTRLAVQRQREAKERRDKAGRAFAAKRTEPKIVLDAQAERAENNGGRARRLAERLVSDAVARMEAARARVEVLTPLRIALPSSSLVSGAHLLAMEQVTVSAGARRLGPWTLDLRGPERVAIAGPNGAGKTTLLKVACGTIKPSGGIVRRATGRLAAGRHAIRRRAIARWPCLHVRRRAPTRTSDP